MIRIQAGPQPDRPSSRPARALLFAVVALLGGMLASSPALADIEISVVDKNLTPIASDWRWLVEVDTTKNIEPGVTCLDANIEECLSVNFHAAYAPPVAKGHSVDSTTAAVDPTRRYYISVLPDSGYAMGGASVAAGQTSVQIIVQPEPLPTAQIRVFIFKDDSPINNIPDLPEEVGLGGFEIILEEAGGKYGASAGTASQDAFGNPLGTSYPCGDPSCPEHPTGPIVSGPDGYVSIKNLAPAKYGIQAVPPPTGECPPGWSGSGKWQQTSTIEGSPISDAWVKANEPPFFVEFGPPGPHVFLGFTQDCRNDNVLTGGATITGQIRSLHMSRPPTFTFFPGEPFPGCWVALNDMAVGTGQGIYAGPCNEDSTFSITGVPAGDYQLALFDANLGLIFGTHNFTVSAADVTSGEVALGDVPVFTWFARQEHMVFNDFNENGFMDPGEPPMPEQNVNLRFRDGTIYQAFPTDLDGFVPFDEIFPFFNWFVAEVDYARFKATGVTIVVDAGGEVPPDMGWDMPSLDKLTPMPQVCTAALEAETGCTLGADLVNPNTGNNLSFTETGPVLTYGYQQFLGQTSLFQWGKKAYDRGENGGISGVVFYAVTRAEDDPEYAAGEPWEPGVPRIQVALYEDSDRDGAIDDLDGDSLPTPADVDNWPFQWAPFYSDLPGWSGTKGAEDFDYAANDAFDYGDAIQISTTDSWDDSLPTGCQGDTFYFNPDSANLPTDCFDGLRNFNQARPAVFDGGYAFNSHFAGGMANNDTVETGSLNSGTYIVGIGEHPVYEVIKEEDRNVDFGDEYVISELLLPPPCVGDLHTVPDYLTLFPDQLVDAGFAGQERELCDRKQVVVKSGTNSAADFWLFTEVPIAGHLTGFILDDTANEFDPTAPAFGEKYSPPFMPVSLRDWTGTEIGRTYSDRWGGYNMLVPSTFTINLPMPSGVGPNMLTACMNSPGPIPNPTFDPRPEVCSASTTIACTTDVECPATQTCGANPAYDVRETIIDPFFKRQYSQFCYQLQYMPGSTTYLDTPVVPIAAFAGPGQDGLDCEYADATPVIWTVTGRDVTDIGPYSRKVLDDGPRHYRGFDIVSAGLQPVPNPDWDGLDPSTQTIMRDYGFGVAVGGEVYILHEDGSRTDLDILDWSDGMIRTMNNIPEGIASGTLIVDPADRPATPVGVSVWFEDQVGGQGSNNDHPTAIRYDDVHIVPPGGSINTAIDLAGPGDLILVSPGTYEELVIMWKPVHLQGWGAYSTTINAAKVPGDKIVAWRTRVDQLSDPNALGAVDILPSQELGIALPEPTFLFTEEGPGIVVLAKDNPANNGNGSGFGLCCGNNGTTPNAGIDGLGITGADAGGGIFVNAFARELRISNNRIFGNAGTYGGGIRIGHPFLVDQVDNGLQYNDAMNDRVRIYRNQVIENGATGGVGGGISLNHGTDEYQVTDNYICGNFTQGEGAGIGHYGYNDNGLIEGNEIRFNQSFNQGQAVSGGGIFVGGATALNVTTSSCAFNAELTCAADTDCPGVDLCGMNGRCTLFPTNLCSNDGDCQGANTCVAPPAFSAASLSPGSGRVTIDGNLIQGNLAGAGDGGGIRLARTHGQEVLNNPDPNSWPTVLVSDNMIVNNVAGLAGAGISLQDAPNTQIFGNTIANNDSTGTAGEAFAPGSPNESTRQPAGIASRQHSNELLQAIAGVPANPSDRRLADYSNPWLLDTIVRRNRVSKFIVCGGIGAPAECPATDFVGLWPQISSAADEFYWDLGVLGTAGCLEPEYSILSEYPLGGRNLDSAACAAGYDLSNSLPVMGSDLFVAEYVNGGRGQTIAIPEVGTSITAQPAFDEGGNFIDVRFGPLQPAGDYHLSPCSLAQEAGGGGGLSGCPGPQCDDFDGDARPINVPDIGADESTAVCMQMCGDNVAEGTEQCDGTDLGICSTSCLNDCTCAPPSCATAIVQFRADLADGSGPYTSAAVGPTWVDLKNAHNGSLFNFDDMGDGWQGSGVPSDPYRLEYDGTNDQRVTIPAGSITELNPSGDHSTSVWFKTSPSAGTPPANGDREIVVEWVERYAQPYEATSVSYRNGTLQVWDCTGAWINTGAALSGDTWYHVVLSKTDTAMDGSGSATRVFLDGTQVYENLASTCLEDQISEVGIGSGVSGGVGNYAREMSGAISQLCIFDSALDQAQAQAEYLADVALYTVPAPMCGNDVVEGSEQCDGAATGTACDGLCQLDCTCPATPPAKILDLRADQADGAVPHTGNTSPWVDLTLNSHDGVLTGFAGDANSGWLGSGISSDPYRLEYDGTTGQGVTLAAGSIPELNGAGDHSHTMAAWFKTSSTVGTPPANGDREIVVEWVEDYGPTWRATSVSYLNGMLQFWDCAGWLDMAPLTGDTWYHVLVSKVDKLTDGNASEVRVYLDGAEVWSNLNSTCLGDQVSEIGIGTGKTGGIGSFGRILSGAIGQVSIWDGALDAAQALAEYTADSALYPVPPMAPAAAADAGRRAGRGVATPGGGALRQGTKTPRTNLPTDTTQTAVDVAVPNELTISTLAVPDFSVGPVSCVGNDQLGRPYDSNAVCMHLSAGDGFVTMADGRPLYIFSFRDVTGLDENSQPKSLYQEGFLGAEAPAPTISLDEGDQFYLGLTNVGMAIRPDLFDPHTVHYHGFPNASSVFDGVPDASISINMNATLTYYYHVSDPGTYMYHCHVEAAEHMQMGMLGNLYVRPKQNQLPDMTDLNGFTHNTGNKYVYNDGDGSTYYDVEAPLQIGSFDPDFHDASWSVQPLPFALMEDKYPLLNGRGYPDTVNPNHLPPPELDGELLNDGKESQRVTSAITAQVGQRILLRISNLNVTNFYTLSSLGIPMELVGKDAKLHRGADGTNLYYQTNSVTLGGGESADVILDTSNVAPGTYFIYTTNLNYLSNNDEPLGGMMTEIVVTP